MKVLVAAHEVANTLTLWYESIKNGDITRSEQLKEEVEYLLTDMEKNQDVLLYYSLIDYRHSLLYSNFEDTDEKLQTLDPQFEEMNELLLYYYYYFKGMHQYKLRNYQEALTLYSNAEKSLDNLPDEIERAEFYYKVASVYYHMRQFLLTNDYIFKAISIYQKYPLYKSRIADCHNVLGLSYLGLEKYNLAEEHFKNSYEVAKEIGDKDLQVYLMYNLGFLYSEKNDSNTAIKYLTEVAYKKFRLHKVCFLLAKEFFKIGDKKLAYLNIVKGKQVCQDIRNEEYFHHLKVLELLDAPANSLVTRTKDEMNKVLDFFSSNGFSGYTYDYSLEYAQLLYKNQYFEEASHFFNKAFLAKQSKS
ncbi:tetratricopeptide repeat protein [Bacillus carboniphilus]|uniref:Tetratricopeptide repeat protein n=1 Tax=Bacillus carboniphilus TaxID=86663 RepID=A0ABN0W437_9BACI